METIVAPAIRASGNVFSVDRPGRHGDVFRKMPTFAVTAVGPEDQGFLTSEGRFVDRREAMEIAKAAGQLIRHETAWTGDLYTEDLW